MSRRDEIGTLIKEHIRYLHQLEITQARMGWNTPPEVVIQIEDRRREIVELQQELAHLPPEELPTQALLKPDPPPRQSDPSLQPDPPMPMENPPVPQPRPLAQTDPLSNPFQELLERWKSQRLFIQMGLWIAATIGTIAISVQAFEPPSCLRWLFLGLANLAGGAIILWFSVQPEHRLRYNRGDRLLTVLLVVAVVGVALWFGYPICSQPNSVPLSCNPAGIALF